MSHSHSHALSPGSLSRLSHSDYYDEDDEEGDDGEDHLILADLPRVAYDSIDREMRDDEEEEEDEEQMEELELEEFSEAELVDDELDVREDSPLDDDLVESSLDEMTSKSQSEQDSIRYEIQQMYDTLPNLADQYKLIDRLGEG